MKLRPSLSITLLCSLALALAGCAHRPGPVTVGAPGASTAPLECIQPATPAQATERTPALPATPTEAVAMKRSGQRWPNCDIRRYYNRLVSAIPDANAHLAEEGKSAEERARAAFGIRHNARLTCRAMMQSDTEVAELRARDQQKYGNPDGPTFEHLVDKSRAKGMAPAAVFDEIVASSQRTDEAVNRECGIEKR